MVKFPKLTAKQVKDVSVTKQTEGWKVLERIFEANIGFLDAEILSFAWKYDVTTGDPLKKSVMDFQAVQEKSRLIKSLLVFLQKPVILTENKSTEIYQGYENKTKEE